MSRTELETSLHEVEACINYRPLTFVGDEPDGTSPLTPSHFLLGKTAGFQPQISEDCSIVSHKVLSEREEVRLAQLDRFWSIWKDDYLHNLPPSVHKFQSRGLLQVGSVVLIREDSVPRMQ